MLLVKPPKILTELNVKNKIKRENWTFFDIGASNNFFYQILLGGRLLEIENKEMWQSPFLKMGLVASEIWPVVAYERGFKIVFDWIKKWLSSNGR